MSHGNDEMKVLTLRLLGEFGQHCDNTPCNECKYHGGDCKMAFALDRMGVGATAIDQTEQMALLRSNVAHELAQAKRDYEALLVSEPEDLDQQCMLLCKMNRAAGVIGALDAVLEEIDGLYYEQEETAVANEPATQDERGEE